jgi:hypothetical protein
MDGLFTIGLVGIGFRFIAEGAGDMGEDLIGSLSIVSGGLQAGVWGYGIASFCR